MKKKHCKWGCCSFASNDSCLVCKECLLKTEYILIKRHFEDACGFENIELNLPTTGIYKMYFLSKYHEQNIDSVIKAHRRV